MAEQTAANLEAGWGAQFEPEVDLDQVLEVLSRNTPATVAEVETAIGLKLMPRVLRELKHGLAILATTPCVERPDKRVLICLAARDNWQEVIGSDKVLTSLLHIRRADKSHLFSRAELERVLPRPYRGQFKVSFDMRVQQQRWPVGVGALYKAGSTQLFLQMDVQSAPESGVAPRYPAPDSAAADQEEVQPVAAFPEASLGEGCQGLGSLGEVSLASKAR